jgi:CheY-like chemotaxis protein
MPESIQNRSISHIKNEKAVMDHNDLTITDLTKNGHDKITDTTRSIEFATDNIVIVVEDMRVNQIIIQSLLKKQGVASQVANNGQEGLDKVLDLIKNNKIPDLILMDIQMPVMDGYESTKKIREHLKDIYVPIFIVSTNSDTESYKKAIDAGVDGYITKPIIFEELTAILEKSLRRKEVSDNEEK